TNTCMNCHAAIKTGEQYGTAEITKIYASIGFDPNTNAYIEDYENLSQEEVKAVFTQWIGDQYELENDKMDAKGEQLIEDQWNHIVESLTTESKPNVQGPIPWVRIHNLPEHVYYNHQQHVIARRQACQTCHGPVAQTHALEQYASLRLGWCINCHRATNVDFNNK